MPSNRKRLNVHVPDTNRDQAQASFSNQQSRFTQGLRREIPRTSKATDQTSAFDHQTKQFEIREPEQRFRRWDARQIALPGLYILVTVARERFNAAMQAQASQCLRITTFAIGFANCQRGAWIATKIPGMCRETAEVQQDPAEIRLCDERDMRGFRAVFGQRRQRGPTDSGNEPCDQSEVWVFHATQFRGSVPIQARLRTKLIGRS